MVKTNGGFTELRTIIKQNIRQYGILLALVFIAGFFQVQTGGMLFTPLNITNLILQNSYILILGIGMLFVIVAGQIDLAVGSIVAIVGAVMGVLCVTMKLHPALALLAALLVGILIGAWQGMWVAYGNIPSFIATLGSMLLFRGITLIVLGGTSIGPFPDSIRIISSGFIPDPLGQGGDGLHLTTIAIGVIISAVIVVTQIARRRRSAFLRRDVLPGHFFALKLVFVCAVSMAFAMIFAAYKGLPTVLLVVGALVLIYHFLAVNTTIGRRVYGMGGNAKAAALSGVNIKRYTFLVMVNMGLLSAVSAIIFAARLNSATPRAGTGFELDAIAACYIGGVSSSGGVGTVVGVVIGALIMGVLNNGMSLLGLGSDIQQAIKGLVLTLAVFFDVLTKSRR